MTIRTVNRQTLPPSIVEEGSQGTLRVGVDVRPAQCTSLSE